MTSPIAAALPLVPPQVTQPSMGTAPAQKQEASRFDAVLTDKAQGPGGVGAAREVSTPDAVPEVPGTERTALNTVSRFVQDLEQGQHMLDRIIQRASSSAPFTHAELLSLQASMYRYTQELDLVSRVVEKGTSGLKDVLKTQV